MTQSLALTRAVIAAGLLAFFFVPALPQMGTSAHAQTPSATFRSALIEGYAASYSYSGKSGYKHGTTSGESSVQHFDTSVAGRLALGESTFLGYGAAFALNRIESDDAVPLPKRLGELTFNAGITHRFSEQWRGTFATRPGYYGDFEKYTGRTLNIPAIALVTYTPREGITWLAGVSVNPFGEYKVMPVVSMRWAFAEDWMLNLGFPRLGVTWQATKGIALGANFTQQGGGYRVTKTPGGAGAAQTVDPARLANTYVNYRELRAGLRAAFNITEKTVLSLEGGWMASRRFDYFDRDYTLKGKSAAYVTLALDARL